MTKTKVPSPALKAMTKAELSKTKNQAKDLREVADEGSTALARFYSGLKKRGVNLDAWKLAEKLDRLDNPAKIQAFLADFDRLRELYGFDDQQQLFEDDKTKPQKDAPAPANSAVPLGPKALKPTKGPKAAAPKKPTAAEKKAQAAAAKAATKANTAVNKRSEKAAARGAKNGRAKLFDEGDGAPAKEPEPSTVREAVQSVLEKATAAGVEAGAAGAEVSENPYSKRVQASLHGAWHDGWVRGAERAAARPGSAGASQPVH